MINVKTEITAVLKSAIKNLTDQEIIPQVEHSVDESHGDYSSNIAMILWANKKLRTKNPHFTKVSRGKQEWKSPFELAQKIVDSIIHNLQFMIHFDRVEAAKPGFINLWVSEEYLVENLSKAQNLSKSLGNKKVMVEFTDPNPFKEFHIGHLYSNTVGESICRILEAQGANLKRVNYQGDVGMHVAKALWGFRVKNSKLKIQNLEKKSLKERTKFLGECYAMGAKVYEEDEGANREIEELNKKIYDKDQAITGLYEKGRQWSLEYFETVYKRLGTKFDFYYFESEVGKEGLKLVKEYLKKGVFEESDGAIIFPGEKYGLHTRVFINSLGLPTYEAKDLGLAPTKYKDFTYDLSIIITAQEQSAYFKVVVKALSLINPELGRKTTHIAHGVVRLPTGKMSSRSGDVITGEWLLDEAKKLLKGKFSEMEEGTLEKVAVGSVKYALLKSSIGQDIEFDFEKSINIQGNSGPYLQYTFVRTQSVLSKAKNEISFARPGLAKLESLESEDVSLLRTLNRFAEVIEQAAGLPAMQDGKALQEGKFAPNLLCNYLFDLAQKFNFFYQKHKIIGSDNQDFRLVLTKATGQIIKNGLNLLGISAPEKM